MHLTTFHSLCPRIEAVAPPEPDTDDPAAKLSLGNVEATVTGGLARAKLLWVPRAAAAGGLMSEDRWSGLNGINTCNSTRQCRSRVGESRCGDILYERTRDWLCLSRNCSYSSWVGDATTVVQLAKQSLADNSWYNFGNVCTPLNAAALSKKSLTFSNKSSKRPVSQSDAVCANRTAAYWACLIASYKSNTLYEVWHNTANVPLHALVPLSDNLVWGNETPTPYCQWNSQQQAAN